MSVSFCLYNRPYGSIRFPFDGFSWNLIFEHFRKSVDRIQGNWNLTRITGTLHEDPCTCVLISHWFILRMRNVSDKSCRENQNTYFALNNLFSENSTVCGIIWKNAVESERPQMIVRSIRFSCWLTKAASSYARVCNTCCCMLSFGWFPGVWNLCADVSEHTVCSIFIGR